MNRVIPLRCGVAFPQRCVDEGIYSFDPISADDLAYYSADARILAKLLGFPGASDPVGESAGAQWFICDTSSAECGSAVPASALANDEIFISRGDRALVELDGTWVSVARVVPPATWDTTVRAWADGKRRDPRLLGVVRDVNGARILGFRDVFEGSREVALPGFPLMPNSPMPQRFSEWR